MKYTPIDQNQAGGTDNRPSGSKYSPITTPVASKSQPIVSPYQNRYSPVDSGPAPIQQPATPAPVAEAPKKQGFVSSTINKTSNAVAGAIDRPDESELGTDAKKNFWKYLPSSIVESLPFGLGAVFKQIHDEEDAIKENPNYAEFSPLTNFDNKDLVKNLPKATLETAKGFVKAPISGAVNIYDAATNKKTKFNIPGLGEVSSAQARTAERVANGENPVQVAIEEGSTAILDTLFFVSLAAKPFQGRPVTTAKAEIPARFYKETIPGSLKALQPKSFRLYQPKTSAHPLTPEFIERVQGNGVNLGPKFNPQLPTYFKMSFKPKTNSFVGEVVQIKPSYARMLTNLFGKKADPGYQYVAKDLGRSGHDLDRAIESGDMPVQKVYKNKTGELTPEYAKHVVADLAGKLDQYKPGLGAEFQKVVDLKSPTPTNLDTQALALLNSAATGSGAKIPLVVSPPLGLTEAQIAATPPSQLEVLNTKEIKADDIENASKNPLIEGPRKYQGVDEATPPPISSSAENGQPKGETEMEAIQRVNPGLFKQAQKATTAEEFVQAVIKADKTTIDKVSVPALTEFFNKVKPPEIKEQSIERNPETVRKLEVELQNSYKQYPEAESVLTQILTELELAEAGKRLFIDNPNGPGVDVVGISSTFPAWIPDNLRTKKSLDALLEVIKSIETISYPTRSNAVAKRLFVNEMLSVLDSRLGIDTAGIRGDILKQYGQAQETNSQGAGGSQQPAGRGSATAERAKIEAKKNSEKADQIARLKEEIATGEDFGGKLTEKEISEKTEELASLEGKPTKTQREKVEEAVREKPKTIKEVSRETSIKEPNVRRILGVGAKEGVFERVDKGVYILSKDGQDLAYVEVADALETLPRLAGEGFKADMVFLDIPYDTPAIKGGNRGMDYNLISVAEFSKVLDATGKIVRDENSPVIHMFSQAPSGMRAMEKYNNLFIDKGWKPVGRGQWQKTFADGSPVTNVRGQVSKPEGILVFTKSGELKKDLKDLNFTLKRPKGYQSEKSAVMLKAMIEMTTEEGDMVLDPFAGSGVTGAEAVRAGRKAYLVEKSAEVAETITKPRVKEALEEIPDEVKRVSSNLLKRNPDITKTDAEAMARDLLANKEIKETKSEPKKMPPAQMEAIMSRIREKQGVKMTDVTPDGYGPDAPGGGGSGTKGNIGVFREGIEAEYGGMDKIRPVEMPELVDLVRELSGKVPEVRKNMGKKLGFFSPQEDFFIALKAGIFENVELATKVLAHEIGHMADYLPDKIMSRGNLIGRLKTLKKFMGETFGTEQTLMGEVEGKFSATRRQQIKNKITKQVLDSRGLKFGDMFGDKMTKPERASLNKEISEKTREAVNEVLEKEGFIQNKVVKKELMEVSLYWRPSGMMETLISTKTGLPEQVFTEIPLEKMKESYQKYRKSSDELYADAISVLLNSPGTLERMAPTFYKEFFSSLDKKPQVFNAYFELQDLLGGDRDVLLGRRRAGVRGMFDQGDMKAAEIQRARMKLAEEKRKNYLFNFKFNLIDKNYALIDRVNKLQKEGKIVSDDENPVYYLEERNYLGGKIKAFMQENIQPVHLKLLDNDISWNDFGEALFYDRIRSGDRSDVANPRGITPKVAEELLEKMKKDMGAERAEILTQAMDDFRDALKDVVEEAFGEGLYKAEMHDTMMKNPAYATFQVLDHLEEGMTSKIHKSIGTLKDVANPADASLLKTISTIRAIERNKVTRSVVEFLEKDFKEDIKPAKTINTPKGPIPQESRLPGEEMITYMKDGKRLGFYVDRYIKDSVENNTIGHTIGILRTMNSTLFRPLFITYNPGFQAFNFLRDFQRFWKNTPTMTLARVITLYRKAVPIAKARAWGIKSMDDWGAQILTKMEKDQILSISYNQLTDAAGVEEKQIDTILADSGIESFQPEVRYKALQPFVKVLDFIKNMGDFIETLPKAAGFLEFSKGGTVEISKEQESFIRKNIGSPDFLAGGYWKPVTNEVFLFSNAITQGIRSDVIVATDPKTRSGYWWKTAKVNFLPKILMWLASAGFFGVAVKEIMDGASEYDKTSYTIIPLGFDEKGKPVYFRMPQDEGGRLLGSLVWKVISAQDNEQNFGKDLVDIASLFGGQLPSVSPSITAPIATGQFISGQNPYDWFRNREVLTDDQMKAGGWYAGKPFLGWLFNQSGGGIFYRFQQGAPRDKSGTEKLFNLPVVGNIVGRFLKVSDYGKVEDFNQIKEGVQSEQARRRLDENAVINKYIGEAQGATTDESIDALVAKNSRDIILEAIGHAPETEAELTRAKNIIKKYTVGLQRGESDPYMNGLISAVTNEEKVELLREYKKTLSQPEYNKLMLEALKYKITSPEVFINASKSATKDE